MGNFVITRLVLLLLSPLSWSLEVRTLTTDASASWLGVDALVWWLLALLLLIGSVSYFFLYRIFARVRKDQIKMQAIWHHLPDILTEVDAQGEIIALNKPYDTHLTPEQLVGTSCYAYLNEEGKALFRQHLHQALSTGHVSEYELSVEWHGQTKCIHNRIMPLVAGSEEHALVVTSDVTRYKDAQRILEQDKQHFERILQSKAQFLINVGQQMRGPSELLKDTLASIKADQTKVSPQQLDTLQASIEHLSQIVDDVALLAQSKQGDISLESVNTSLWHLVDDLEALYLPQANSLDIDLMIRHAPLPHYVLTDVFRLRQVLYNLMSGHLGIGQKGKIDLMIQKLDLGQGPMIQFTITNQLVSDEAKNWVAYFNQALEDGAIATLDTNHIAAFKIANTLAGHLKGMVGAKLIDDNTIEQWFTLPLEVVEQQDSFSVFKQTPITLAIHDESIQAWFHVFFQSMQLPFVDVSAQALPNQMSLLVSDHCQPDSCQWLWWLGEADDLKAVQGVALNQPYRREALYYRLSDYQSAQSDSVQAVCPGRILLVEDNLNNQLVIKRTLEKLGYEVVLANNGEEGVAQFKALELDCIIMDVQMPVMDGIEATREIRKLNKPYVPVIALTANSQKEIEEACFAAGMDSFLTKPISRKGIQSTLEAFLGKRSPGQDSDWVI